jgi:putative ATP-dependent endonuclease of OLD family
MENLEIKNYKCFDDSGSIIESFKYINIIIGKNNSGKSSIIDIIKFLTTKDIGFFNNLRNGKSPQFNLTHKITDPLIRQTFPSRTYGGDLSNYRNHQEYGLQFVGATLEYEIKESSKLFKRIINNGELPTSGTNYFNSYVSRIPNIFEGKNFIHLTAERDIQPEISDTKIRILPNGSGATNFIQQIINKNNYDSSLIEKKLLNELNQITNPDIFFSRILVQLNNQNYWEIYFENKIDGRIPLSKMGSGVKTILLVLLLIVIEPELNKRQISNHVFALEELENNLHPSQQRRLYYYLYKYSIENKCVFFFTTHSNIVIDLYNKLENTQILHINRTENSTIIKSINKYSELNQILDDLDIKASDILQSNSIIWVEGPSDRTFLNKWISLLDSNLVEGYHYSIMFYGGRLLSNLTADYENLEEELIPLIKLNRNCFVVMDRDGKTINQKLNKTKMRISEELGDGKIWITKGREIENYLTHNTINIWLKKNYNFKGEIKTTTDDKLETIIETEPSLSKLKYNLNKNKFANEIINFVEEGDLNYLDLKLNIENIISHIKNWNK